MACAQYSRPLGVLGGPCLICGCSQPEHAAIPATGYLEVGTTADHAVVINLPADMTGHIIFSPEQARALALTLERQAADAERARRAVDEAARIAAVPPADRSNTCTTSGEPVSKVRAEQTESTGQHKSYIVLCAEERAKGFVRPYRDAYVHRPCGTLTTMGRALSETYARDPKFYSATFCVRCNAHFPVDEFNWRDGDVLGS